MRVTVNDIAREMNIAQGTVSKALHGRVGVNPVLREQILQTAKRMGYQVNRVAQSLARDNLKIGIICPGVWQEYHGLVVRGIQEEMQMLRDYNFSAEFRRMDSLSDDEALLRYVDEFAADSSVNAVLICPASCSRYEEACKRLTDSKYPCVVVGSEIKTAEDIGCVHINSEISGRLAAEYMAQLLPAGSATAVMIGSRSNLEHRKKEAAYRASAQMLLGDVVTCETYDNHATAYTVTGQLLQDSPNIRGIYCATGNSPEVCHCLSDLGRTDVVVIGTDAVDAMLPFFEAGTLKGVLYQSPIEQGRIATRELFLRLTENKKLSEDRAIVPFLLHHSNIEAFIQTK